MSRRVTRPSPADWIRQNRGNAMKRPKGKVVYVIIGHTRNPFAYNHYGIEARVLGTDTDRRVVLSWRDVKNMVRVSR